MGLTNNQIMLIKAVSQNNLQDAKQYAIACCAEDTTQKNKYVCQKYLNILRGPGMNMLDLPYDLKGILCMEDVTVSFKEGRYYLSDREKSVYENIVRVNDPPPKGSGLVGKPASPVD